MNKTAIVIGATGLVGSEILNQLLEDESFGKVKILHRRTTGINHPKLEEHIIDFDEPVSWRDLVAGDELYSALGTTIKKAGSQEKQYTID
ncbi:MAG: NAD-dependent epimerase/dehydratase family protein, partial [Balneolaceae bacterium]